MNPRSKNRFLNHINFTSLSFKLKNTSSSILPEKKKCYSRGYMTEVTQRNGIDDILSRPAEWNSGLKSVKLWGYGEDFNKCKILIMTIYSQMNPISHPTVLDRLGASLGLNMREYSCISYIRSVSCGWADTLIHHMSILIAMRMISTGCVHFSEAKK